MPTWMSGGFGWGTYVAESRFAADGRATATDLGNTYGASVTYGYEDGTNRLTGITLTRQNLGVGLNLSYGFDAAGNVTSLKDQPTASPGTQDNQCLGYDGLRRLEVAWTALNGDCATAQDDIVTADVGGAQPYWTEYEYDTLGNRTSMVEHGVAGKATTSSAYSVGVGAASPHQIVSLTKTTLGTSSTTSFEYDEAGNRTQRTSGSTTDSYVWDAEGELASDDDYTYIYDASGNRIVRDGDDGTTVYLPGGQEVTIDGSAVSAARYYSFAGRTIATRTSNGLGGVTSLVADRDGSVVAAVPNTEWTTASLSRVHSDPFGAVRGNSDAGVPGDHRFLGATRDADSGLTLLGARYYDAVVGCFISVDPVLNLDVPAHLHAYAYGFNNPVSFADPSGMEPKDKNGNYDGDYGGGGGASAPSTSWAAAAACSDASCTLDWMWSFTANYYGGIGEILWGTLLGTCSICHGFSALGTVGQLFTDPAAVFAQMQAEQQQFGDFWSDPWNNFWTPIGEDWANNPGHAAGSALTQAGLLAVPGGAALKAGRIATAEAASVGVRTPVVGQGFNSFGALKRALPPRKPGEVVDHIVEQCQSKCSRAGIPVQTIQNTANVEIVPAAWNQARANYYSSIDDAIDPTQTVRNWLSTQSYDAQFAFGTSTLEVLRSGGRLPGQ